MPTSPFTAANLNPGWKLTPEEVAAIVRETPDGKARAEQEAAKNRKENPRGQQRLNPPGSPEYSERDKDLSRRLCARCLKPIGFNSAFTFVNRTGPDVQHEMCPVQAIPIDRSGDEPRPGGVRPLAMSLSLSCDDVPDPSQPLPAGDAGRILDEVYRRPRICTAGAVNMSVGTSAIDPGITERLSDALVKAILDPVYNRGGRR
jgi:hypothetical protein